MSKKKKKTEVDSGEFLRILQPQSVSYIAVFLTDVIVDIKNVTSESYVQCRL